MSGSLWDGTIRSFLREAGSSAPTPGGGGVAAVAAALGAAMTQMVANLSQGERFADVRAGMEDAVRRMEAYMDECERLLHADAEAFNRYMSALRLPKATDAEKLARREAIGAAARQAIDVPLRLMALCREGVRCALDIAETSNKSVASDLGIGAVLFAAAARSAALTAEINLGSVGDAEVRDGCRAQLDALSAEIGELRNRVLSIVRERIRY